MISERLTVQLDDQRSYPIVIGENILADINLYSPFIQGKQICLVTNETIAPLYLNALTESLSPNYHIASVILPDGEAHKTLETLTKIYDCLLINKHYRTTTLIALGGGVIGDMTGFAAASYQRGVHFIQVPTTLLSQVDSSVGGKTGVNHPLGKNMIGAFHQPQTVIIDTRVLTTLARRELSAGIAEIVKYGLLADADFYHWLETKIVFLLQLDPTTTAAAIAHSCRIKAEIVSQDEKESGIRAILNLGHTFGHAVEAALGYGQWLHGEAVAVGMVIALELSAALGWVDYQEVERLKQLLQKVNLPTQLPETITVRELLEHMALDKKIIDGKFRLVLIKAIGHAVVTDQVPLEKITSAIQACR